MIGPYRQPLRGIVEADETIIPHQERPDGLGGPQWGGKMLVAGAVELEGGTPRRTRLKVVEGFGKRKFALLCPVRWPRQPNS
jgi:hypothetical protein